MKAVVFQENLAKALNVVLRAVGKSGQGVLNHVMLAEKKGGLEIVATNLEMGLRVWIPGKVDEKFEITVPARQFGDFVAGGRPGQIALSLDGEKLKIEMEKAKAVIGGVGVNEFPVVPTASGERNWSVKRDVWVDGIGHTVFAASSDEGRPALTGVLLETIEGELVAVATDGYRLSKVMLGKEESSFRVLVPARTIGETIKIVSDMKEGKEDLEVWLSQGESQVIFKFGDVELVSRLLEGNFPDYKKIIPVGGDGSIQVVVDKQELSRAVKLSAVFARETANIVKMKVESEKIVLVADSPNLGSDEVEVDAVVRGGGVEMAFNCKYLQDFLNNCVDGEILMETTGALAATKFGVKGQNEFVHIIMPMRVQG